MATEENKEGLRNWRFRWLGLIFEFAHLEYQRGLWIERKYPNEIGWFSEDVCSYFDDLYLDDNYQYQLKEKVISIKEYEAVQEFHFAFDNYLEKEKSDGFELSDKERIDDENWIAIVDLANSSWDNLKSVIIDKEEIEHMLGLENNYLDK